MYCNLSKTQVFRVSLTKPTWSNTSKIQFLPQGGYQKPSLNPSACGFSKTLETLKPPKSSFNFGGFCVGFALPSCQLRGCIRVYSNLPSAPQRRGGEGARKKLPWLGDAVVDDSKRREYVAKEKPSTKSKSSWELSAEKFVPKSDPSSVRGVGERSQAVDMVDDWRKPRFDRDDSVEEKHGNNVIDKAKWERVKMRVRPVSNVKMGSENRGMQRWDRQEDWGRKTYREAHESSVPKMVGEGVYGVGPVLAALSSGRREFFTLYVQDGLELSKNHKKKKDKKGFEKVLKIAEKIGLSLREISKHDLNMIVDNRPHQGLVLDASPLEMVSIKELDPVSIENDKGVLWIALDEVTDPQNLGAIIRSSYFFGATGVVLCAKNSAPLSGVVSKASAGSLELMEIRACKNMMQFLTSCAQNGWRVLGGSVSSRAVPLREIKPGEPTILVLGSEGKGLRPLVQRSCTELVRIPGNIPIDVSTGRFEDDGEEEDEEQLEQDDSVGNQGVGEEFRSFMAVESLNVSVAAGVLLHHLIGDNYMSDIPPGDLESDALG